MNIMMLAKSWQAVITSTISDILTPVLVIACSVGTIYAVVVGIKMLKAEDKAAREENKQRLINIAISIASVLALIAVFYALQTWLEKSDSIDKVKDSIKTD